MRNIEQCHICKQDCQGEGQKKDFYFPQIRETGTVPENLAKCGLFLSETKAIQLRKGEKVDKMHTEKLINQKTGEPYESL